MIAEKEIPLSEDQNIKKSGLWFRIITLCLLPGYALIGWLRLAEALKYWEYLYELNIWPRPLYFAITGALIGAGFSLAWIFLLFKIKVGILFSRIFGWVFLVWFWVDRIWFSLREAFYNQLLIAFIITAITLTWIFLLSRISVSHQKEDGLEPKTGTGS
jgi:hypothetical protein